jgi:hypothetical protein
MTSENLINLCARIKSIRDQVKHLEDLKRQLAEAETVLDMFISQQAETRAKIADK